MSRSEHLTSVPPFILSSDYRIKLPAFADTPGIRAGSRNGRFCSNPSTSANGFPVYAKLSHDSSLRSAGVQKSINCVHFVHFKLVCHVSFLVPKEDMATLSIWLVLIRPLVAGFNRSLTPPQNSGRFTQGN